MIPGARGCEYGRDSRETDSRNKKWKYESKGIKESVMDFLQSRITTILILINVAVFLLETKEVKVK